MDGVVVIDGFMNRIENKHHKKIFRYILSNSTIGYEKKNKVPNIRVSDVSDVL